MFITFQPPPPYEPTSPSAPAAPLQTPPNKTTPTEPRNYGSYNSQVCLFLIPLVSLSRGHTADTNNAPSALGCVVHRVSLCQTAVNATTAELLKKQEELEKKARELERRERELESHSLGPGACKGGEMGMRACWGGNGGTS